MKLFRLMLTKDRISGLGIWLSVISALIYALCSTLGAMQQNTLLGLFFLNYLFSVAYLLVAVIVSFKEYRWKIYKAPLSRTVMVLVLWLVSAFALNRVMNVFDESVLWLSFLIVIAAMSTVLLFFLDECPVPLRFLTLMLNGAAAALYIYYGICLIPLYLISVPGALALGIALHSFVPIALLTVLIIKLSRTFLRKRRLIFPFIIGLLICITAVSLVCVQWTRDNKTIAELTNHTIMDDQDLPAWVRVSSRFPQGWVAERLLRSDLTYKTASNGLKFFDGGVMNRLFDDHRMHDPLIVTASFLCGKANLSEAEKIKILETASRYRHQAQERLWAGDKLRTENIITNVRVYPEYRLAYTEKVISIRNTESVASRRPQEAIYTFNLPEGGVVSSLSLWINGREHKARITTKSNADSAYRTIVGIEKRDPSLVTWMEGNRVSVRIFPCLPNEDRQFKIGVSSPLVKRDQFLSYNNVTFSGPVAVAARELLQVRFSNYPGVVSMSPNLERKGNTLQAKTDKYVAGWAIQFKAPILSSGAFSFSGNTYVVAEAEEVRIPVEMESIYLDLNSKWNKPDFEKLWAVVRQKKVYVYADQLIRLTEENKDKLFDELVRDRFSIFPFYHIKNARQALLVTKGSESCPDLSDLKGSVFASRLSDYLAQKNVVSVFELGESSAYLNTLKQLRAIRYTSGTMNNLLLTLKNQFFKIAREDSSSLVIPVAGMTIRKVSPAGSVPSAAPDHLLRLFAYNDIMKKVSSGYFDDTYVRPDVISLARQANVVSPVSSLIVLENKKEYDRFGINENKNALKNASMKSSGAVPEPAEWLLIFSICAVAIYCLKDRYQRREV